MEPKPLPQPSTAVFEVTVSCFLQTYYNWLKDGAVLEDDGRITGATTPQLTISDITAADVGKYLVSVSTKVGAASCSFCLSALLLF